MRANSGRETSPDTASETGAAGRLSRAEQVAATRNRILETAIGLFNDQGTAAVSTNHVASAAGLSVGNLYYHFRSKEEIVRAIQAQIADGFDAVFSLPPDRLVGIDDLSTMLRGNYALLWRYRFFYRELIALLNRDPALADAFRSVRQRGFANFSRLLDAFCAGGVLRPIPDPNERERLAILCWLVSENYPTFVETGGETLAESHVEQGVALLAQVLKPYLHDDPDAPAQVLRSTM